MPSLRKVNDRFVDRIEVIENGSGYFQGIVDEPSQGTIPAYQFTSPRRLVRTNPGVPIKSGMVIRTKGNATYIVGDLGDSDDIFQSFRLFEVTGRYLWQHRTTSIDPVTELPTDSGMQTKGTIWGTYEPDSKEALDRQLHLDMETGRFITNADIQRDDIVDGKRVTRVDHVLGLKMAALT